LGTNLTYVEERDNQIHSQAINMLERVMYPKIFLLIILCETAKEISDELEVNHEGNLSIYWSKLPRLSSKMNLFTMEYENTSQHMYSRLNKIVVGIKGLGDPKKVWRIPMLWSSYLKQSPMPNQARSSMSKKGLTTPPSPQMMFYPCLPPIKIWFKTV
jgi:hypothetical protein